MHMLLAATPPPPPAMSYFHAVAIGLLQGVTELFPISSLGHSVLVPALLGWKDLGSQSSESPFLAFLVGLHVATALALLAFFWRDWLRIITGFFRTLGKRRIDSSDERLAWLIVLATIPVGVIGLVFEHSLRTLFAKPLAAAIFLTLNGGVLGAGEWLRRRAPARVAAPVDDEGHVTRRLDTLHLGEGVAIGTTQIAALFAGISRSGVTMVGGLLRGLDHEDAARFSFLLATPIILAAGLYKIPSDLFGPLGAHIHKQVLAGSVAAAVAAFVSVKFLVKYFETRTLTPFAIYCAVAGALCILRFA